MADFDSMMPDAPAAAPTATPGSFDSMVDDSQAQQQQYGTPEQQTKAGLEGLGRGIAGPIATAIEKQYYRVPTEDIKGRAEANPITAGVGEAAGLLGGALTGTGEAAGLTKAGEMVVEGAGLAQPATYAAKIGSSALKQAAEMALYQTGDEASKAMVDPNLSAESTIANIGLATALGGAGGAAFGAISPLWKATSGSTASSGLKAIASHLGGIEGEGIGTAAALEAKAGVELPTEFKAVLDDVPGARESHSVLRQSDSTITGRGYQAREADLNDRLGNRVITALGENPEALETLPEPDKYATGRNLGETLHDELKPIAENISSRYDAINDEFKKSLVNNEDRRLIADQITQKGLEKGWQKAESVTADVSLASKVLKDMSKQQTVEDLKQFITNLRNANPYGSDTYQAAKEIANVLKNNQERIIAQNVAKSGGDATQKLANYNNLKSDYSKMMNIMDGLNEHLHVGRYDGPQSFLQALKEMSASNGETVLNRLSGVNKADVLSQLSLFPKTLQGVKNWHVQNLLDKAVKKAAPDTKLNVNNLIKNISQASPQIKSLIASPQQHEAIAAVGQILEGLKDPTHNFSNTARTAAKLLQGTPSALSLLAALTGHTGAGILSFVGKLGFTEGKDALRLGMMRFLSSDKPLQAEGFKSMVNMIDASRKGMMTLTKASEAVFQPGLKVLTSEQMPSALQLDKLDKLVASNNPTDARKEIGAQQSKLGHYLPDHQTALTQASLGSLQYLKSIRPQDTTLGALSKPVEPTKAQEARYDRALEIAQQPAIILQHIKNGTLQPTDMADLQNMYPSIYQSMAKNLTQHLATAKAEGKNVPYKTQMGISLFLGQPVETTMEPTSIQAAQMTYMKPAPQQPQGQAQKMGKRGTSTLGKSNQSYKTPSQAAEGDRQRGD